LAPAPRGPAGLCEQRVSVQHVGQRHKVYLAIVSDCSECLLYLIPGDGVLAGEEEQVGEIAPPGVGGSALERGDDFLSVDHGQRVAGQLDRSAEQPWQGDCAGCGPDGITDIDVDVQA